MNRIFLNEYQSELVLKKYGLNVNDYFLPIYYDADIPAIFVKKKDNIEYINLEIELQS